MRQMEPQNFSLFNKIMRRRKCKLTFILATALLAAALILDWSFVRYRLLDGSLSPVFWGGQKVVTFRWAYLFRTPERNDLIIYTPVPGTFCPGKVLGLPGDRVTLVDGQVFINNTPLPGVLLPSNVGATQLIVPREFICVGVANPVEHPARLKLVPTNAVCGKILGHWQVLII